MKKVRNLLDELEIPYAVDVDNNDGLLTINALTKENMVKIAEKLGNKINFYDYVGTINGSLTINSPHDSFHLDLGNVHR